jgi:hypothetical protein
MELKQVFATPDGRTFETKAEAESHLRAPKIKEALIKATDGNKELADWLQENQDTVESAFETGTIRRVTKSEHKKLVAALEAVAAAANPKFAFIANNIDEIATSFRWPSVKRMTDDEKHTAALNTLVAASDNPDLAQFVLANKDSILEAYEAGKVKREINAKAAAALAEYRERKRLEKEQQEAA